MVSKCANPNCSASFRYLREGALLFFESNYDCEPSFGIEGTGTVRKGPRRLENFWLCADCSSRLVFRIVRGKVVVVPRGDAANPALNTQAGGVDSLGEESRIGELK